MEIALLSGVAVVDMEDAVVVLLDLLLLLIFDGWFPSKKKKKINGGGVGIEKQDPNSQSCKILQISVFLV